MKKLSRTLLGLVIGLTLVGSIVASSESKTNRSSKRAEKSLEIKVIPWGPTQVEVEAAQKRVGKVQPFRMLLRGVNYRMMSFEYIENNNGAIPTRYRVVFYDYTNDKTFVAEGDFAGKEEIKVLEASFDPGASPEELEAATAMIKESAPFADSYKAGKIRIDGAMPPTTYVNGERLVNMTITPLTGEVNEIVGISFKNNQSRSLRKRCAADFGSGSRRFVRNSLFGRRLDSKWNCRTISDGRIAERCAALGNAYHSSVGFIGKFIRTLRHRSSRCKIQRKICS